MPTIAFEFAGVALSVLGALASIIVGSSQVKILRQKTGDDSALTSVLSGAFLHRSHRTDSN
jgi:hypothetical protein